MKSIIVTAHRDRQACQHCKRRNTFLIRWAGTFTYGWSCWRPSCRRFVWAMMGTKEQVRQALAESVREQQS